MASKSPSNTFYIKYLTSVKKTKTKLISDQIQTELQLPIYILDSKTTKTVLAEMLLIS
jgi:hypothetical protein